MSFTGDTSSPVSRSRQETTLTSQDRAHRPPRTHPGQVIDILAIPQEITEAAFGWLEGARVPEDACGDGRTDDLTSWYDQLIDALLYVPRCLARRGSPPPPSSCENLMESCPQGQQECGFTPPPAGVRANPLAICSRAFVTIM
jgi:hypothetical protein